MNATDYWLFAREYSIWNATVAALQFWTADLEPHILSIAIEQVFATFFYTTFMPPAKPTIWRSFIPSLDECT